MRIAALDLGDVWVGIAVADPLGIAARPYCTVKAGELVTTIQKLIDQETVRTIVVGDPQTLRGTVSAQTEKVRTYTEKLKALFPDIEWVLWDERLTSKQAARIKPAHSKEEKQSQHAVAAALILSVYLDRLAWLRAQEEF
jgi:putative holliday junction resolvase